MQVLIVKENVNSDSHGCKGKCERVSDSKKHNLLDFVLVDYLRKLRINKKNIIIIDYKFK